MSWNEVSIYTQHEALEALYASVMELGISSAVVEDPEELKQFIDESSDSWDMVDDELYKDICAVRPNIKIYISDDEHGNALLSALSEKIDSLKSEGDKMFSTLEISTVHVKDEDWQYNWREFFKPFALGEKLYIRPVWESETPKDKVIIDIDPGSSFGSGQHETTRLALMALEVFAPNAEHVADIGSGSGILSAAAAKLVAKKVTAIDIDENAVTATRECARANGVEAQVCAKCGDLCDVLEGKADVVVANIFAGPIIRLCESIKPKMQKGGVFIATGIIEERVEEVKQAFIKNGFEITDVKNIGQWYLLVGKLKA